MRMSRRMALYASGAAGGTPTFTYTGTYQLLNDAGEVVAQNDRTVKDWKIRFLTSGTLVFTDLGSAAKGAEVFCVGGGSAGAYAGGAGGYTTTGNAVPAKHVSYPIYVGAGGVRSGRNGTAGGVSSAIGVSASGGKATTTDSAANGGSGGGKAGYSGGTNGGSDGSNGVGVTGTSSGQGQHSTTREFGLSSGKLYAGGGGGGRGTSGSLTSGGAGGGGRGGDYDTLPAAASANTGGGGGGSWYQETDTGAAGGSGIVVMRNARAA